MSDPLEVAKKAQKDAEANLKLSVDLLKDARKANDEAALALQDILQEGGADPNRTRHSQKYYDDEWRDRMATWVQTRDRIAEAGTREKNAMTTLDKVVKDLFTLIQINKTPSKK